MPKNKISEFSSTPANNTDIGGIDIAEGCAPSGINNAIRELMAQLKDQQAGTDADNFTVGGNLSVTGTSTLTGAVTAPAGITGNLTGNVTGNVIAVDITSTGNTILGNASTDTLNVGNGGLVKDASQNVGIGTASPTTKLDVVGAGNPTLTIRGSDDAYTGILNIQAAGGGSSRISWSGGVGALDFNNGADRMRIDSSGNLLFNSGYGSVATAYGCRAWVNFNGTGTVAIRGSGNVSSITDNGTGDYTVNFTTALVDANYATNMTMSDGSQANWTGVNFNGASTEVAPTTSAVRMTTSLIGTGTRDQKYITVSIFR